jgi:hypothetical protein
MKDFLKIVADAIWQTIKTPVILGFTFLALWGLSLPLTHRYLPPTIATLPQTSAAVALTTVFVITMFLTMVIGINIAKKDAHTLNALGLILGLLMVIASLINPIPYWVEIVTILIGVMLYLVTLNIIYTQHLQFPTAAGLVKCLAIVIWGAINLAVSLSVSFIVWRFVQTLNTDWLPYALTFPLVWILVPAVVFLVLFLLEYLAITFIEIFIGSKDQRSLPS